MMPSENEDFDAAFQPAKPRKPRTRRAPTPQVIGNKPAEAAASPRPVAVLIDEEPAYEAPAEAPETPQEAAYASTAPEVDPELTPEATEPQNVPEFVEPFAAKAPRTPRRRLNPHVLLEAVLVVALIGLGLWTWNLYQDRQNLHQQYAALNANPEAAVKKQTDELLTTVGALMNLPTGEEPTIANVSDANAARQQSAFFKDAQNGDKVLMYVKAGEAILYRPSTNKIILVAPLTTGGTTATQKP